MNFVGCIIIIFRCLGSWKEHLKSPDAYGCTKENPIIKKTQKEARSDLERYSFFYERYSNNKTGGEYGYKIKPLILKDINHLSRIDCTINELEFLNDAVIQVILNREFLSWSYVYSYYIDNMKHPNKLFDEQRGMLNYLTEMLQDGLENELDTFISYHKPKSEFIEFRNRMIKLITSTKTYLANILSSFK